MKRLVLVGFLLLPPVVVCLLGRFESRPQATHPVTTWMAATLRFGPIAQPAVSRIDPQPRRASDHWSFQPIRRPELPMVRNLSWPRNPVDSFVLAKLEDAGFAPAAQADRRTLIRRLSLDLRGLPPTPAEVSRALADSRPDWYERVVEDFLASPAYAERWTRFWLDMARYADSDGFQTDQTRSIWKYRDWVLSALAADLPFDQFLREQVAGDLIPGRTADSVVATGFLRNAPHNRESGVDPGMARYERVVDWTNTVGTVFLGLTLECAQCHNHKYDPISQREYYELLAFFNSAREEELTFPTRPQQAEAARLQQRIDALKRQQLAKGSIRAAARRAALETLARRVPDWSIVTPVRLNARHGTALQVLDDQSILASGPNPRWQCYEVEFTTFERALTGVRLELLPDPSGKGIGRNPEGLWEITHLSVTAAAVDGSIGPVPVDLVRAQAVGHAEDTLSLQAIDDDEHISYWGSALMPKDPDHSNVPRVGVFEFREPLSFAGGTRIRVTIAQRSLFERSVARFRLAVTASPPPLEAVPDDLRPLLTTQPRQRSAAQEAMLDQFYGNHLDQQARLLETQIPKPVSTLVLEEEGVAPPTHIYRRGEYHAPQETVEPGTPGVLPELKVNGGRPDRLHLADWLTSPHHPLVARVFVNRVWQRYFGRGLVETDNDWGARGTPPSHPELLDWLAGEFIDGGWRLKDLHRRIVTSATYRQSTQASAALLEHDPQNRLLGRQRRLRLEAEALRDSMLAASGRLSTKVGGPPVFPYQAPEVVEQAFLKWGWKLSAGEDQYRLTLYTFVRRNTVHPLWQLFDGATPQKACTHRQVSTTPLQALMLLNDPSVLELARALALRVLRDGPADEAGRITLLYQLCLARPPQSAEVARVRDLLALERQEFQADVAATRAVGGESAGVASAEAAAWTAVARVLFNVDEFLTRE